MTIAPKAKSKAVMTLEIFRAGRRSFAFKIGRGCTDHPPTLTQFARNQAAIGKVSHTDGHIGFLCDQIHNSVGETQFNCQIWIAGHEGRDCGSHEHSAERKRGVDPQPTAYRAAGGCLIRIIERLHNALRRAVIGLAFFRHCQCARRPHQQACAKARLQSCNQLAYC
ncbi:hypothetical protein AYR46_07465 [Sphingobium yanoikuyae]|nr:hypothetical protein AYR46_07465 [Sphingobium yanoikuyae]